jgi:hypothetical protein
MSLLERAPLRTGGLVIKNALLTRLASFTQIQQAESDLRQERQECQERQVRKFELFSWRPWHLGALGAIKFSVIVAKAAHSTLHSFN